jgi:hypothetical protein
MISARSVAVEGFGLSSRHVALRGLVPIDSGTSSGVVCVSVFGKVATLVTLCVSLACPVDTSGSTRADVATGSRHGVTALAIGSVAVESLVSHLARVEAIPCADSDVSIECTAAPGALVSVAVAVGATVEVSDVKRVAVEASLLSRSDSSSAAQSLTNVGVRSNTCGD